MSLAEQLGATVNLSFSKDDHFDFCVAKTVNSPKYLLARARGVPAATPAWLRDSAAAHAFLPLEGPDVPHGYRPPPFAGLSVCVTGHSQHARAEIESRVVAGGGAYASDLVKGVCTHLVAADTTSAKYAHAARWDGVRIVTEAWVRACVDERARADETEFSLAAAGDASGDASGRKTRDADAEDDAQRTGDVPNERDDVPWESCFLLSARVCLRGFERDSEEHARALRVVRRAGAGTVSNPAKATHVVVPDDPPPGSLSALKELRDRVVHLTWLEACEAEARVADEEPHLVAPSLFVAAAARGATEKRDENAETSVPRRVAPDGENRHLPRSLREAARGRADRAPEREPRRRGGDPAAPNPLTRAALAKEAEAEATRAAAPADQNRPPDAGASEYPATGTELPATAFAVPETAAAGLCAFAEGGDEGGGPSTAAAVFRGERVALSPLLSREEEDAAREFISAGSGVAVACSTRAGAGSGVAPASAKYVVCPAAPTAEERRALLAAPAPERAKQVTCHWLETCVQQERVVDLTERAGPSGHGPASANPAYRPLPCDAPLPSMQSLRISTSTYDERIKASVHMLCHLLGARYTDRLGRNKNTHLIAPAAEGAKYTAAMSWGIHVVTVEWLHACVAAGERVDEAGFAPPPPEPEDETEAPGGDGGSGGAHADENPEDFLQTNKPLCSAPENLDAAADGGSQRPRGSQRQRGAAHQVGSATARASLSAVLQVSQPAAVTVADVPAPAPPAPTPAPTRAPARRPASSARAKTPKTRPKTPKTPQTQKNAPALDAAPETQRAARRSGGRGGATPSPRVGGARSPRLAARAPAAPASARAPPDGSQFAANMIDDVAAGMLGVPSAGEPGSLALDDVGDGFRVPDAVFGKRALASPSKTGSQRSRGDDADGASSGKKRRRDAHSQGDLETQHMVGLVGYADDDQPVRRGGPRGGEKPSEKRQNAGLVTSLLEGGGAGGGARGAGVRAEDWE